MQSHPTNVMVRSNEEGMRRVSRGGYAMFMESTSIEYFVERRCNLMQVQI